VRVLSGGGEAAYSVCADVLFAFDRAEIRPGAASVLRQVARSLAKRYPNRRIQIDGHTDSQGSPSYNQRLSVRRAEAVKRWLVAHGHIAASRISTRGYGETQPVTSNASGSGRQRNRRVVVGVLPR
jgi:outer membrane protein OmpA-like peptidoglycan-associated protein